MNREGRRYRNELRLSQGLGGQAAGAPPRARVLIVEGISGKGATKLCKKGVAVHKIGEGDGIDRVKLDPAIDIQSDGTNQLINI